MRLFHYYILSIIQFNLETRLTLVATSSCNTHGITLRERCPGVLNVCCEPEFLRVRDFFPRDIPGISELPTATSSVRYFISVFVQRNLTAKCHPLRIIIFAKLKSLGKGLAMVHAWIHARFRRVLLCQVCRSV